MTGPFTEEERALRRSRLRLMLLALPLTLGATVAALVVLLEMGATLSPACMAMAILTLALSALNVYALAVVLRAHRTAASMRETALNLLQDMKASFTPVATDAQLVARVGEKLAARTANLETERDALKAILAAMNEGILVVDSRRNVIFSNPAARKILGIPDESAPAQSLHQLTQHSELAANIEMSLVANQTCSFEFELDDRQKRYIQAHCSPYKNEKQALFGAVAVLHDITELRRLERMRTEFVANVSHELRTPLTSLIGYLETMGEAGFDDQVQAREFLAVAHRQAEQLGHLVEDLLRLSRLENPQSDIAEAAVLLNEVVHSAVDQCASLAAKRAIDLRCETPDAEVWIDGDRGLLVQAVGNLIENAINYNHENGSITVSLSRALKQTPASSNGFHAEGPNDDDFDWQIAVSDSGIGIPGHALNRIFERFYRVDKARSRSQGGTGLGLAIVKHIALAHGASVHVESEVGKGSTFFIRLKARRSRSERLAVQV